MAVDAIQYATSRGYRPTPSENNVVGETDQLRIAAYDLYDGIYHNRPETLELSKQGENAKPIYMPSGKKIVDSTSRYLCVGFDYFAKGANDETESVTETGGTVDQPLVNQDSIESGNAIEAYFANFFVRERIKAKFATQKQYGLIRGDAVWYLTADPKKPAGERLSLHELDPRQYFPIDDPQDNTRVIGCHIVDLVQDPTKPDDKDAKVARRQTYRKEYDANGVLIGVSSERSCWEVGKWDDRILKPEDMTVVPNPDQDVAKFMLPGGIKSLPTYHIKNKRVPNSGFGMSELAGLETLIFAINQAISDEDLTLAMQGLGMYVTNAGAPQNSDGSAGDWAVGPGQVVEIGAEQEFTRVTGVSSVAPYTEHTKAMDDAMMQGAGIPEIASGAVDVAVAESGIALMIQMAPVLAKNFEKELEIILTIDQMFYDIVNGWLPGYEGIQPNNSVVTTIVDDPMPVNRDAKIQELMLLYTSGVITLAMVVKGLMELGYTFSSNDPEEAAAEISAEQKQKSIDMMGDPYADPNSGVGDPAGNTGDSAGQIDAGFS